MHMVEAETHDTLWRMRHLQDIADFCSAEMDKNPLRPDSRNREWLASCRIERTAMRYAARTMDQLPGSRIRLTTIDRWIDRQRTRLGLP
jgi:hypothetical protein